ncbi:MAG TPA: triose-phosphate isomerase [Candidatus Omnitrophota bacterium]|nr:triose-phosphate isomerase [Candidatus Omnitrophota bacterium]
MKPIIIVNFKTYKQGEKAVQLAKKIEKFNKNIIVGVQVSDIKEISQKTKLKIYAQHVDYFEKGRHTGYIIPESVKADGADGTFLNHSEHKLNFNILKKTIARCKKIGLKTAVFAGSLEEAKKIKKLHPDILIVEPPELVGGKISVSSAKPELIKRITKELKTRFLVGAGIHTGKDVQTAMKLGASGIAVSSSVMTARNPIAVLKKLTIF